MSKTAAGISVIFPFNIQSQAELSKDDTAAARLQQLAAARQLRSIPPLRAELEVENISQYPELANGCEITSATMVLNYLGFDIDKITMADEYLPRQYPYYSVNPEHAYMGSPHTGERGWYCYAPPVVEAINSYFADVHESGYRAIDLTGASINELKQHLASGHPLVIWGTVAFQDIQRSDDFIMFDGRYPYSRLHVMVLTGYDSDNFYISDPLNLVTEISAARFEEIYTAMGSRAVAVI